MKSFGHTKTLFIQAGKYKWSFKYEHCIVCKTCDSKHKGRGLCTKCADKERAKTKRRKEQHYNASLKWHKENYQYIPQNEWKKKEKVFDEVVYRKQWYEKNKEVIAIFRKGVSMIKKGSLLPTYKGRPIPFDIGPKKRDETTCEYKERTRKFDLVKKYLNK